MWIWWHDRNTARLLASAVVIGAVCAIVQMKFYYYHMLPFAYQLAVLAGFGFSAAADHFLRPTSPGRWSRLAGAGAAFALALPPLLLAATAHGSIAPLQHVLGGLGDDEYMRKFAHRDFSAADTRAMAELVAKTTAPGDSIYLWGFDALVYFLADRPAASRFGYNYPMITGSADYKEKSRQELLGDLDRNPPRMILVEDNDDNNLMQTTSRAYLGGFPELESFIARYYVPVASNAHYLAYARR